MIISTQEFCLGTYINVLPSVEFTYTKQAYISWATARKWFKLLYPHLELHLEIDPDTKHPFFKYPVVETNLAVLEKELEDIEDKLVSSSTKKLENRKKYLQNILYYPDSRGFYLKPYILDTVTEEKTPSLLYGITDASYNTCYTPNQKDFNDNMQRAFVKTIAIYTGIGNGLYENPELVIQEKQALLDSGVSIFQLFHKAYVLITTIKSRTNTYPPLEVFLEIEMYKNFFFFIFNGKTNECLIQDVYATNFNGLKAYLVYLEKEFLT